MDIRDFFCLSPMVVVKRDGDTKIFHVRILEW